jgi:hypothetical protein
VSKDTNARHHGALQQRLSCRHFSPTRSQPKNISKEEINKLPIIAWKGPVQVLEKRDDEIQRAVRTILTFSLKAPIVPPLYSVLTLKRVLPLSKEHGSLQLLFRLPLSTRFTCFESANYVEVINSLQSFRSPNHMCTQSRSQYSTRLT